MDPPCFIGIYYKVLSRVIGITKSVMYANANADKQVMSAMICMDPSEIKYTNKCVKY